MEASVGPVSDIRVSISDDGALDLSTVKTVARFRQPFPPLKFFIAAFVNRYRRLTDIAGGKIFSLRSQICKATFDVTGLFQGDG